MLVRSGGREVFAEERVALLFDIGKAAQEIAALFVVGPFREDDVNEFVDARFLGAGRPGRGNNLIDHGDDRIVLMSIESAQRVARSRVGIMEKAKKIGRYYWQNAASK